MKHQIVIAVLLLGVAVIPGRGQTKVDLRTQSRSVDFTGAGPTKPMQTGAALPVACGLGELFFLTSAAAGQNLYACVAANTWVAQSGINVPPVAGQSGKILTNNGSNPWWTGLSGDVNGPLSGLIVTGIQGKAVSNAAPAAGQALVWNGAANQWTPQTVAIGGGGAGMASQLGDFGVVASSPTQLTIGTSCSLTTPCNVRFGATVFSVTSPATATLSAGTGAALIYFASNGTLTVGHTLTLACSSACSAQSGVTSFPPSSIPLFTWTAANGVWNGAGGSDQRAFLSAKLVTAGTGLIPAETQGTTSLSVDASTVPLRTAVPATAASACNSGAWAADGAYFYICAAANTWRRTALASW